MKRKNLSPPANLLHAALVGATLFSPSAWAAQTKVNSGSTTAFHHPGPKPQKTSIPASAQRIRAVKTRLTELFNLCKSGNARAAASYFVYRGQDEGRKWKDTYRASDPGEKAEVEDICARITGYLDESDGYRFGRVKVERETEGAWHVVEVSFRQGEKTRRVAFAFLLINGQFAIGDIDRL